MYVLSLRDWELQDWPTKHVACHINELTRIVVLNSSDPLTAGTLWLGA